MNRSAGAILLAAVTLLPAQEIHFKTRNIPATRAPEQAIATDTASVHKVLRFDHAPGVEDLDALLKDGIQVVAALPDNAVVVAAPGGQVRPRAGITWMGAMDPADKLSPALEETSDPILALVEFHPDVTPAAQETIAGAEGFILQRPSGLRADHAIVTATPDALQALARHDEVAYIFPADPDLLTDSGLMPCMGMLTAAGPVGQYANIVHGWNPDADGAAHIGYAFGSITPKAPAATVRAEIVRALTEWTKSVNIQFQPATAATSARSVAVKFVSGAHGDSWPFDGPGGVLAHTFYPVPINAEPLAGDMHLDADENWHAGSDMDIYSVALHEAGHAIGLGHSDKVGDAMYPYYRSHMALSANDIGAAQSMYGAAGTPPASPTPVSTATPPAPASPGAPPPPAPSNPVAPSVTALRLALDSPAASTQSSTITLTGTLSGGTSPYSVQWQSDHGYSGRATLTGNAWSATGVALVNGANTLTVTAFDAARQSASQAAATSLDPAPVPPSAGGGLPVSVSITSPAGAVSSANSPTLTVAGGASGGSGITRVTWQTAAGATGVATGTSKWLAQGIPLLVGTNTVVMRAWDSNGASAWSALVVVRR